MRSWTQKAAVWVWLIGLPTLCMAQSAALPNWSLTDSTLLVFPHGDLAEILQSAPAVSILAAGEHGQPAFLSSGFGDIFGTGIAFNGVAEDSYLLPFFDPIRWSPAFLGRLGFTDSHNVPLSGTGPVSHQLNLQSFWKSTLLPFVRVHYLTHDFGREEVFALFQKTVTPSFRVQPFGSIGHYSGWRPHSTQNLYQTGFQVQKGLANGKTLNLFAILHQSEAGFPGAGVFSGAPVLPRLKRKLTERRIQGEWTMGPKQGTLRRSFRWQFQNLAEEWTNFGSYFHEKNEESTGILAYRVTGHRGKQAWGVEPGASVHRLRYKSVVRTAWLTTLRLQDAIPIGHDWQFKPEASLALGNWKSRCLSVAAHLIPFQKRFPTVSVQFTYHRGGLLSPVLRDSTSFHWDWLRATPLFGAVQRGTVQRPFRVLREGLSWPILTNNSKTLRLQLQGVHWLRTPGVLSIPKGFHAANLTIWGNVTGQNGFVAEAAGSFRVASVRKSLWTSALPNAQGFAAFEYHHTFFQGDLHAALKILARVKSSRWANVSSKIGSPIFVRLPAAAFWDVYAHFQVADLRFFFAFENLLNNADYWLPGYPVAGRRLRFGLVWDFWN